jgi:hypothetical protein
LLCRSSERPRRLHLVKECVWKEDTQGQ